MPINPDTHRLTNLNTGDVYTSGTLRGDWTSTNPANPVITHANMIINVETRVFVDTSENVDGYNAPPPVVVPKAVEGVPVGTIIAYPSYTPPPGWLLCGGGAIPAQYVDLIALVGATTPDLRTRFIRGAQSEAEIGVKHRDSTKLPNNLITATTDSSGTHWHGMWDAISGWHQGTSDPHKLGEPGKFGSSSNNWAHPHPRTSGGGDHTHTVTLSGGDAETAPIHMTLAYIIYGGKVTP
jgi:hypothetical protein